MAITSTHLHLVKVPSLLKTPMPSKKQSKEIEEKNLYLIPNFEIPNSFHNSLVFLVNRMSRKN
jgi:hypothetical protein